MIDLIPGNLIDVDEYERAWKGEQPPDRTCPRCEAQMPAAWTQAPCVDCWNNELGKWRSYGYEDAATRARVALGMVE